MYIDEYIKAHPEKLPEGEDLMKFSAKCEMYLGHAVDLVPYNSPNYAAEVFDICIAAATPDPELESLCKYHDEYFPDA